MARREGPVTAPARGRVGLPVVADGSRRHPRLVGAGPGPSACNNGCVDCVSRLAVADRTAADGAVAGHHVVIHDREPTLRRELPATVRDLRQRGAAAIALVTNGRLLGYPARARALRDAGLDRAIVKLFALTAAEHDAIARVDGAHAQALAGIAAARAAGLDVVVSYVERGVTIERAAARAQAHALTERDPVVLPEPEVVGHANEFRYDVVTLRAGVHFEHAYWDTRVFPMVHVNTGPLCNIRCVYCNVRGGTDQRLFDAGYVEQLLDDAAARILHGPDRRGAPTIDLIGGEPTMHPELPRLIAAARARGFARVLICTNGVRLARPGYLDELIAAGLTGVRLSFHDHRAEVAAGLADVAGLGATYPEVAAAVLARPELDTHLFRILLADTLDALPDYLRWLAAHNRTGRPIDLTLGLPSMRGRLFDNRHLYPPLARVRPTIAAAMALAHELGFAPTLHHAPACAYPDDTTRAACLHVVTQQVDAARGTTTVMNFEGDAVHGEACARCPGRIEGCAGLPRAYFDDDRAAAEAWLTPIALSPGRRQDR